MHLRYRWNFVERSAPPHEQLRYYRNFRGLLGKELAALIGVNHATIVNYENLKSPFDYNNAIKIAEVLQIEKELLFDDFNKFIDYPYHQKLKEVRTELHMTQVEFAAFSGINRSTLSAWEKGTWIPTRENYILLAEAFQKASGIKEDPAMTHSEKRVYLIKELLSEQPQYRDMEIPDNAEEQKRLLRSLMNIRSPRPIGAEFLKVQDEYLNEEVKEKGITDSDTLPVSPINNRLVLWRGDITTLKIDAIVNAANSALRGCFVPCHSCVDNIIHSVSGIQLRLACDELMTEQGYDEPTGKAKITPAFNLPCSYVLHTVGPIVSGILTKKHCEQLADCYKSCLELASDKDLKSIAFCCISTGEFHFPQKKAAEIAVQTVIDFLQTDKRLEKVVFNVFKQEDYDIYKRLLG